MRAVAIFAVLMTHATGTAVVVLQNQGESLSFHLYNSLNTLFRFGTPSFILLSSFILFYNYYHVPVNKKLINQFYKKRLLYILIPYFFVSIGYYWFKVALFYDLPTFREFISDISVQLLTGTAHSHLYFVFISIQFYLFFPAMLALLQRFKPMTHHLVWLGLVIQWGFVLTNHYYLEVPNKGSWSFSYMSYFFTGAYFGIYFTSIKEWLTASKIKHSYYPYTWILLWVLWGVSTALHIWLWYQNRLYQTPFDTKWFELMWNVQTMLSALLLFQVSFWIYRSFHYKIVNIFIHLGVASFGVYLFHPFFLMIVEKMWITGHMIEFHLSILLGGFSLVLLGSWMLTSIVTKYIPYSWMFFGAIPKNIPYKQKRSDKEDQHDKKKVINR